MRCYAPLMLGGFVLGLTPLVYAVLEDLGVFEGGPVLLDFVFPDDGTRAIGALSLAVIAGAVCRVVRGSRPGTGSWWAVASFVFLGAVCAGATLAVRLLDFKAPSANTAMRVWLVAVVAASVVGAAISSRLQAR